MTLNADQQAAATAVFQFLLSDDREFSISGPAGTGKTYMMHHIRNTVLKEYQDAARLLGFDPVDYEIELCATTNKAAEVLMHSCRCPASTIQSFLGLKVFDDYKTGETVCKPTANFTVKKNKLIFIDEASMIDRQIHKYILEAAGDTCKVIYLGDHCQLAPVNETLSPVYARPSGVAKLTQPMRNAGQPALMALCAQLRHTIETGEFKPIREVPGVVDYLDTAQAQAFIDQTFATEGANARMLARTNARVHEYNGYVRGLRGYPDHFVKGEKVLNTSGIKLSGEFLRVEQEIEILQASSKFETIQVEHDAEEEVLFDIQHLTISTGPKSLDVRVPANRAHFKELLGYYKSRKAWAPYFWLKNNFPDLRQRDAATVHKSQGSTYDTVFLDLSNIGGSFEADQVARMLYVAASRATTRLVLFGQLPRRYQSSLPTSAKEIA